MRVVSRLTGSEGTAALKSGSSTLTRILSLFDTIRTYSNLKPCNPIQSNPLNQTMSNNNIQSLTITVQRIHARIGDLNRRSYQANSDMAHCQNNINRLNNSLNTVRNPASPGQPPNIMIFSSGELNKADDKVCLQLLSNFAKTSRRGRIGSGRPRHDSRTSNNPSVLPLTSGRGPRRGWNSCRRR